VSVAGPGTVASDEPGVACTATCTSTWDTGSTVRLVATPGKGQRLASWAGACKGASACDVTLDAAKSVTARFVRDVYKLQVRVTGRGKVTGAGVSCPSRCAAVLASGTTARMTAKPARGWKLRRWTGPCVTASIRCSVPVNAATKLGAIFVRR
jgi:hypothetical protein